MENGKREIERRDKRECMSISSYRNKERERGELM